MISFIGWRPGQNMPKRQGGHHKMCLSKNFRNLLRKAGPLLENLLMEQDRNHKSGGTNNKKQFGETEKQKKNTPQNTEQFELQLKQQQQHHNSIADAGTMTMMKKKNHLTTTSEAPFLQAECDVVVTPTMAAAAAAAEREPLLEFNNDGQQQQRQKHHLEAAVVATKKEAAAKPEMQRAIMATISNSTSPQPYRYQQQQQQRNKKAMTCQRTMPVTSAENCTTTETSLSIPTDLETINGMGKHRLGPEAYCCCGAIQLRHAALGIAWMELFFFGYQLITNIVELVLTSSTQQLTTTKQFAISNEHNSSISAQSTPVSNLLTLLSLVLAVVAVCLLLLGVIRRSALLLLPHLLMQFSMFVATLVITIFLSLWLLMGVNFRINAIFFDHSLADQQDVLNKAQSRTPIEADFTIKEMQVALGIILLLFFLILLIQLLFIHIVLCTYRYLRSLMREKCTVLKLRDSTIIGTNANSNRRFAPSSPFQHQQMHAGPIIHNTTSTTTTTTGTGNSSANCSPPPPAPSSAVGTYNTEGMNAQTVGTELAMGNGGSNSNGNILMMNVQAAPILRLEYPPQELPSSSSHVDDSQNHQQQHYQHHHPLPAPSRPEVQV